MGAKFEVALRFKGQDINMPKRATANSAGYDLYVAEDTVVPSLIVKYWASWPEPNSTNTLFLEDVAKVIKDYKIKPTLVSTGVKCKLDPGTYLEVSVRSSTPLKYLLLLANGVFYKL